MAQRTAPWDRPPESTTAGHSAAQRSTPPRAGALSLGPGLDWAILGPWYIIGALGEVRPGAETAQRTAPWDRPRESATAGHPPGRACAARKRKSSVFSQNIAIYRILSRNIAATILRKISARPGIPQPKQPKQPKQPEQPKQPTRIYDLDHIQQISYKYSAAFCRLSILPLNTDIGVNRCNVKRRILNYIDRKNGENTPI